MLAAVQALRESGSGRDRDRGACGSGVHLPGVRRASSTTWCARRCRRPSCAVGESFWDFSQVTDDEVRELLATPDRRAMRRSVPASRRRPPTWSLASPSMPRAVCRRWTCSRSLIGDARIVLIGESSHGTHEFYEARAEITKWLIEKKGFNAVAAEADWPDAYRVNRYVRGLGDDGSAGRGTARIPAVPRLDVAQRRRSRLRRLAARHNRRLREPTNGKRASTGWTSTACIGRCRRSSPTSTTSTHGRGTGTGALRLLRPLLSGRRPGIRLRRRVRRGPVV